MANLTPQIRNMFSNLSMKIANNANDQVKNQLANFDQEATLMKRLSKTTGSILSYFTGSWRPFKPDAGAQAGLKIFIRQNDAQQLDTPAVNQQLTDIVQEATREEVMKDPKSFLEPLLQDFFNNPKTSYLKREDEAPNRQLKMFD